jgi:hypothetical protein
VNLPRDVDIRSLAAILFAFVVVIVFLGIATIGISCRFFGTSCIADNPASVDAIKSLVESIIAILLALMAGTAGRPPPASPPKDHP